MVRLMGLHDSIMSNIGHADPVAVDVPEWGCKIYLRQLSVGEWLDLVGDNEDIRPWRILSAAMQDESGNPVLTADEITALPSKQTPVLLRLFQEVQRINGADDTPGED